MTRNEHQHPPLFVGIATGPTHYRACVLSVVDGTCSVQKTYGVPRQDHSDLSAFIDSIAADFPDRHLITVGGLDDRPVGFYTFDIPTVNDKQTDAIVASQAELHLPFGLDQVHYTWRRVSSHAAQSTVTVVAALRSRLAEPIDQARRAELDALVLHSEAVLHALQFLCDDLPDDWAVLRIIDDQAKLLVVRNGVLIRVTTFDGDVPASSDQAAQHAVLLSRDIQQTLLNDTSDGPLPIFIDAHGAVGQAVSALLDQWELPLNPLPYRASPMAARRAPQEIEPLGLALTLAQCHAYYALFASNAHTAGAYAPPRRTWRLALAAGLAAVIFVLISYGMDRYRLGVYERHTNSPEFAELLATHRLRTAVAHARLDVPEVLTKLNAAVPKGLTIDSLQMHRSKRIAVAGTCKDARPLYDFLEALSTCPGIADARITHQDFDEKKKHMQFTVTFDYKNFTSKRLTR